MMEFIFFNQAGQTLFTRSDMESGHWVQHEMSVNAVFPFDPGKVIQRGQRIAFRDPATDNLEVFEIRQVSTLEPDHYQQLTAEQIALSELSDEHIDHTEITDQTAAQALTAALAGTLWQVGTDTSSGTQSADFARGSVWQAVNTIKANWNVYITPRVVVSAAGVITGKYLDISPAGGVWRGVRLSVRKNLPDPTVTYNDEEVLTALYGYGGTVNNAEVTFKDEVWTATADHPAKPANQTYLEWPEKTALYGRNGRPRYGYYQNANITSPSVLLQKTWEALKRTAEPKIRIAGSAADLSRIGYAEQPLRLHDLAIVEIAETGEVFQKEIITLDVDLVDPTENQLEIGDYIPNIVYINRETARHASGGGGGGGRGQTANEAEQSETFAEFAKTNDMIGMVVGTTNGGYYIKAAEIVLSINQGHGTNIKLEADTIDINGVVSALAAQTITVYGLYVHNYAQFDDGITVYNGVGEFAAGVQIFNGLACDGVNVTFGSDPVSWQTETVVTSVVRPTLALTDYYTFMDTGGTARQIRGVTTWSRGTVSSKTIHFLGY
jgi:phage minor structural protein